METQHRAEEGNIVTDDGRLIVLLGKICFQFQSPRIDENDREGSRREGESQVEAEIFSKRVGFTCSDGKNGSSPFETFAYINLF